MPEENNTEDKKEFDFDKVIEGLEDRLSSKMNDSVAGIEDRIAEKVKPKEPVQSFDWGDDDDEDDGEGEKKPQWVSKKDLKAVVSQVSQEASKIADEKIEARSRKQKMDMRAFQEFPELHPQHAAHNKKLASVVNDELENIFRTRKGQDETEFLYDAATRAVAKGVREGWYNPRETVVRDTVKRNAAEDNFDVTPRGADPDKMTPDLSRAASKIGMTDERAAQLLKIRAKYKK